MQEPVDKVIYQVWTSSHPMEGARSSAFSTSQNLGVNCVLLDNEAIEKKVLPEYPLHPAYKYLSSVGKADYMRCYLMHHFGGGYADIKHYSTENNWSVCFDLINSDPSIEVVGVKELTSPVPEYNGSQEAKTHLVANGYFIVRPHSAFSTMWYNMLMAKMDEKHDALKENPAKGDYDKGAPYPLRWEELQGEIFHRVCYHFKGTGKVVPHLICGRQWVPYR